MALDEIEIARIRRKTGSVDLETEFPDTEIQYYYDQALIDAPDSAMVLPYTFVYILRDLWGMQRLQVDRTTEHGDNERISQAFDWTKEQLDYWEGVTGLSSNRGGRLSTGVLSFGLDQTEDDDGE